MNIAEIRAKVLEAASYSPKLGRASLAFSIMVWDSPAIQAEAPECKLYLDYWQGLSDEAREEFWQEADAARQSLLDTVPVI